MSTKQNKNDEQEYYDDYEGVKNAGVHYKTQCEECEYQFGFDGCKQFGKMPYNYASILANVPCPKRKGPKYINPVESGEVR